MQLNIRSAQTRRHALAVLASAATLPLLSACSAPVAPLRMGSIVFPGYELMFLAREMGWLDSRKVRLVEMRANTDTMRALASHQLEAAAMTLDELITARADGVDLRAVMVFDISAGADVVLAKPEVTLQTLAGKRVGVEDGAMGAVMLSALLTAAGVTLEQIHKVPLTLDRSEEAFNAGRLDAVVTAEPWAAHLESTGAKRIFDSTSIPGRIVDVLAVRADALKSHSSALRQLVSNHFAARKYWHAFPDQAAVHMAERLRIPQSQVVDQFRGLQLPDAAENTAMMKKGGRFERTTLELQRVMQEAGLLPRTAVINDIADPSFLPT